MTAKHTVLHSLQKWLSVTLPVGILAFGVVTPPAHAGKPGVFLDDQTFFTVEQVLLSSGSGSSNLQFALKLQNGGGAAVNMNDYGVRLTDANGYSFPAQLAAKESAQVASGQSTVFHYSSNVPANDTLDQLQVDIFKWDYNQSDFMDDLGALPVSQAAGGEPVKGTVIRADEIDGSLPSDAELSVQLERSYLVHENNEVHLYTDLYVKNNGSTGFQLPSSLKYRIFGTQGDHYSASAVSGADGELVPKSKRKITLRAAVPGDIPSVDGHGLQFYTENQGFTSVLGALDISGSAPVANIGENQNYLGRYGATEVVFTTVSTLASAQSDGLHLYSTVEVQNNGTETAALPALSASFQFNSDGSAVTASDSGSQPAYVPGKDSVTYHFQATLPSGLQPGDVKLVLFGKEAPASSSASASAGTAAKSTKANTNTAGASNNADTSDSESGGTSVSAAQAIPLGVTSLNGAADFSASIASAKTYNIGDPLYLEYGVLNSNLEISLVEFHVGRNDESDFQTGIAKFRIRNKGNSTLDLPSFETSLVGEEGDIYTGTRQTSAAQQLSPDTGYVVSYSYVLPGNVSSDHLALNVSAKGTISNSTYRVVPQSSDIGNEFDLYPYHVKLNSTVLQWLFSQGSYTPQLKLDATATKTDQTVMTDSSFSPLGLELVDPLGRILATASVPFTGVQRLATGTQTIKFDKLTVDQVDSGVILRLFETVRTPFGTAKRIIKEIQKP